MSVNTCGEKVGISTVERLKGARIVLANFVIVIILIVIPDLIAGMVEAQLSGRDLHDNISVVSHSLVRFGELRHQVISEDLVANARRTETVELNGVCQSLDVALDVENGKGGKGSTKRVAGEQNRNGTTMLCDQIIHGLLDNLGH